MSKEIYAGNKFLSLPSINVVKNINFAKQSVIVSEYLFIGTLLFTFLFDCIIIDAYIMAWLFRKKIKIVPGISINLSKSGISLSAGPKGAKMTVGRNGAYLYTGIPGTGLYNRKKIVSLPESGASISTPSSSYTLESSLNISGYEGIHKNKGCFNFFMWVLCIFSGLMTLGGIITIVNARAELQATNQEYSQLYGIDANDSRETETQAEQTDCTDEAELREKIEILRHNMTEGYVLLMVFATIFILSLIWIVRRYSYGATDSGIIKNLENIRNLIANTDNPLKKKILNNHLGCLIRQDADRRLKPLVDKWAKKAAKNPEPKIEEQFRAYEELYKSAIAESDSLIFNVNDDLSDAEKKAYADFCKSFKAFGSCSKVWKILFSVRNTEMKSSAYTNVEKSSITLKTGAFDKLSINNGAPTFPVSDGRTVYFYPQFVVVGKTIYDFDVLPIDKVNIVHKSTRFIEDGVCPADAEQVDTTYKYINKNGSPDRRYSYNPVMPVLLYGDITLLPYGDTFQVSNNDTARKLAQAFKVWKSGYISGNKEVSEIVELKSRQSSPVGRTCEASDYAKTEGDSSSARAMLGSESGAPAKYDSLFVEIARDAVSSGQISTSYIQRNYEVGFNRAGRIMTQLERAGIVGPQVGAKQREIKFSDRPSLEAKLRELGLY